MRKGLKLFFLFVVLNFTVTAQLNWLNPKPSGQINNKLVFINANIGYLMNANGDLFVTNDTGTNWQLKRNFPSAETFELNDSTGVIPIHEGAVYISTNNGNAWEKRNPGLGTYLENWTSIIGRDTILLLTGGSIPGTVRTLYRSVDRGNTWLAVNNNMPYFYIRTIRFVTSRIGYASSSAGIVKTIDGGISWQVIYPISTSALITSIKFFDTFNGFAYRDFDKMLKTTDGGITWTESNTYNEINDIFWIDLTNAYAVGDWGLIIRTTDGGVTWNRAPVLPFIDRNDLYSQYFFNDTTGIVTGYRGRILKTRNGGISWTANSPTYIDITSICYGDFNTAYATTWNNVYKSTDAGNTWNALALEVGINPSSNLRFEHSYFWSKDSGILTTSDYVRIYKTTDGGQSWTFINPAPPINYDWIKGISFISKDTGFIQLYTSSGGQNALYKTTDGGSSWLKISDSPNLLQMQFLNSQLGYSTSYSAFRRTVDGGVTWTDMNIPASSQMVSLWFTSPSKGLVIHEPGHLKMTSDSGNTWIDITILPNDLPYFQEIRFFNDNIGYLTDKYGYYYRTTDGGYNWTKEGQLVPHEMPYILFHPDSTVIFAGMYGSIVSTTISSFKIDSLKATTSACSVVFTAKISAYLSPIDSIFFEYSKGGDTSIIAATPFTVLSSATTVNASVNNFTAGSTYNVRVKILFRGKHYYSDEVIFIPAFAPMPVITATGNILHSSYNYGNQWYHNSMIIPGANNQDYFANVPGAYTVIASQNGCPTLVSIAYNLTDPAIDTIGLASKIFISPNPVSSGLLTIRVEDTDNLKLKIIDFSGKAIKEQTLNYGVNSVKLQELNNGIYIFIITDPQTHEKVKKKIVKL